MLKKQEHSMHPLATEIEDVSRFKWIYGGGNNISH